MAKPNVRKIEPVIAAEPRPRGDGRAVFAVQGVAVLALALSVVAMLKPELRLWAVHQTAFLHPVLAIALLLAAALLISPWGGVVVAMIARRARAWPPVTYAAGAFAVFMVLSVYGSLLGDGQLALTRLAHIGDMLEEGQRIPAGRFFSQKEPGTMLLHESAFRIGMAVAGPEMNVASGRAGQQARVERQLAYRDIAQWCFRILSSLAGALLVFWFTRFLRTRHERDSALWWSVMVSGGVWLMFFGYVENYAWVSLAMLMFLAAGIRATEPPRRIPIAPILIFSAACALHFMAIVLLPALVFLLWTLHFEQHDLAAQAVDAPRKRVRLLVLSFAVLGLAAFFYLKAWDGWSGFIPLLPRWVKDGYALLSVKHGVDLLNLFLWVTAAPLVILLATKRHLTGVRSRNQEYFLLLAAGSGVLFACTFSPNLGMARDWDVVGAALWPLLFYGAWRLAQFEFGDVERARLQAALLALTVLMVVSAVLVQTRPASAIERFRALLELDRSRSAYGWENLALYYQREGDLERRVEAWSNAVAVERNPRYLYNLAEAFKLSGRIVEADTMAVAAARMNPDYASNLFYYVVAQAKRGDLLRARELVTIALEIDPQVEYGPRMRQWVGRACEVDSIAKLGDIARARELLAVYTAQDSSNSFWREYALTLGR